MLERGTLVAVTRYDKHEPVTPANGVVVTPTDTGATGARGAKESANIGETDSTTPKTQATNESNFFSTE